MTDRTTSRGEDARAVWRRRRRRERFRRFRRVPLRFIAPNLVTLLALCLGLTAIRFATEGQYENAVVSIVVAAILDGLDGRIARALNSASRFGAELDSLADFVDFGVAPALLLYLWSFHAHRELGWFAAMVFAVAAALRLARFNVMIDDPDRPSWQAEFFVGMPAPAGAVVVMLPLTLQYALGAPTPPAMVLPQIAYALFIAFLMVSRIPHFSGKRIPRVPREYIAVVLLGVVVTILLVATYPMPMLVILTLCYLAQIPLAVRRWRALKRADAQAALAPGAPVAPAGEAR